MLIMLAESQSLRRKLVRHPADAGLGVGLVAGWLAGQIVQGTGFGVIGDLIIGIVGAFIGDWLLPQLGVHLGVGIVAAIINATTGALVLLLIVRLVRGTAFGGGWGWR